MADALQVPPAELLERAGYAAEARYWEGVTDYKATNSSEPLQETARVLSERYPESPWTKKASVWR